MAETAKEEKKSASAPALKRDGSLSLKGRLQLAESTGAVKFSLADLDFGPRARLDIEENPNLDPQERSEQLTDELEALAHSLEKQVR